MSGANPAQFSMKTTRKEYDAQTKAGVYQIIGRSTDSNDFGGGTSNAILLDLNARNKANVTGVLAMAGTVYELVCRTP